MKSKRLWIIVGCVVVGGLLAVTAVLWWIALQAPKTNINPGSKTVEQYSDRQELVDAVNQKYGTKDYTAAIQLIEGQKDAETNVELQLLLARAYANAGNLQKSLSVYKKLSDSGKLPKAEYGNMGDIAALATEYQIAIEAYKKAKESAENEDAAIYDSKIAEMEKKL